MAKKKNSDQSKKESEMVTEPVESEVALKELNKPKKEVQIVAPKKVEKAYSFEQWAKRRGVPKHHHGGMRAFVKNPNKSRSLEQWDKLFANY